MRKRYPLWEIPRPLRLKYMVYRVLCLPEKTNIQKSAFHELFKSIAYSSRILLGTITENPYTSFCKQYIKSNQLLKLYISLMWQKSARGNISLKNIPNKGLWCLKLFQCLYGFKHNDAVLPKSSDEAAL